MVYTLIVGSLVGAAALVAGTRKIIAARHKQDPILLQLDDSVHKHVV